MSQEIVSTHPTQSQSTHMQDTLTAERRQQQWLRWLQALLFLLPGLAVYGLFMLVPVVNAVYLSMTEWNGISEPVFNGLANYAELFQDADFLNALGNNIFFIFFYTLLPILLGLLLAALVTRARLWGMTIFRTGLFIPQVLSTVVVGIIWRWFFATQGPINQMLTSIGLESWVRPWLGDFTWAPYAAGAVGTWVEYGLAMVLFIAGVQAIDSKLYDAAVVDGANAVQQFLHVTLPGLRQQILVAFIVTFIAALRVFGMVFVLTRGGPGNETDVVSMRIYEGAFRLREAGYSTAMAVVLAAIIIAVTAVIFFMQPSTEETT
jgi:raffinose/stachyose/melibiose transport system permease protein